VITLMTTLFAVASDTCVIELLLNKPPDPQRTISTIRLLCLVIPESIICGSNTNTNTEVVECA
jgi:hypothetical protein